MNTPREIPRYVTQSLSKVRNFIGVYIPCVVIMSRVQKTIEMKVQVMIAWKKSNKHQGIKIDL